MDNYTYPMIVFKDEEKNIIIQFPDFDEAVTDVDDERDIITVAQDVLALAIIDRMTSEIEIPSPSNISDINVPNGGKAIYVNIWLPYHNAELRLTYTKKTLTIPTWIDMLAKNKNINFSRVLVDGLKKELGIKI